VQFSSPVSDIGTLLSKIWSSQCIVANRPAKPLPLISIDVPTVPEVGVIAMPAAYVAIGDARNSNVRVTVANDESSSEPLKRTSFDFSNILNMENLVYIASR